MDKWAEKVCKRHGDRFLMPGCRFRDLWGHTSTVPRKKAERVIVSGFNGAPLLREIIGLWRQGAVPCLIPPTLSADRRRYCQELIGRHDPDDREAVIMFTSSTSGSHPKGVRLSHDNLLSHIRMLREHVPESMFGPEDRTFAFLPWTHCYGLMGECMSVMDRGASMGVMSQPWSVPRFVWGMHTTKPTILFVVPKLLTMIGRYPRWLWGGHRLRCIVSGGAYLPPRVRGSFPGLPILQGYGLTEMSPMVALQNSFDPTNHDDVGSLLPGVSVELTDDHEIVVNGPNRFLGYLGEPDLLPHTPYATGDCGRIEKDGRLVLLGRNSEMIKLSNGRFVSLTDVEEDIVRSCPSIREICLWQTPYGLFGVVCSPRMISRVSSPRFGMNVCVVSTREPFLRDSMTMKGEKARGAIRSRFCLLKNTG